MPLPVYFLFLLKCPDLNHFLQTTLEKAIMQTKQALGVLRADQQSLLSQNEAD
jgi:hypothetical protein